MNVIPIRGPGASVPEMLEDQIRMWAETIEEIENRRRRAALHAARAGLALTIWRRNHWVDTGTINDPSVTDLRAYMAQPQPPEAA